MTNDEKLIILAAARELGFNYIEDGKLSCTLDQLCAFSESVANSALKYFLERTKNDK